VYVHRFSAVCAMPFVLPAALLSRTGITDELSSWTGCKIFVSLLDFFGFQLEQTYNIKHKQSFLLIIALNVGQLERCDIKSVYFVKQKAS
jgi:hypothetical protein